MTGSKASAATRRSISIRRSGSNSPICPARDCVHKFHDGPTYGYSYTWKRFESLVKQRPIPILYETPGRELIQHDITKEILGVRAQPRGQIDQRQGAQGGGADLRRL